jgi:hypothetical protein
MKYMNKNDDYEVNEGLYLWFIFINEEWITFSYYEGDVKWRMKMID